MQFTVIFAKCFVTEGPNLHHSDHILNETETVLQMGIFVLEIQFHLK